MTPHGHLASSGFALARRGHDYVALRPAGDDRPLTLELAAGTYAMRWFDIGDRIEQPADDLTVAGLGTSTVECPFGDDHAGVVHLQRVSPGSPGTARSG
jgi:hypothetical protein